MEEREPGFNAAHGFTPPDEPDSAAIRFGSAFEDAVIELAEREQGKKIKYREEFFANNFFGEFPVMGNYGLACPQDDYPLSCHVDGIYSGGPAGPDTLHEGKTTSSFTFREKWGEPRTEKVPREYQVQVQHQMICTGAEKVIVSVLVFPETPEKFEAMGWTVRTVPEFGGRYGIGTDGQNPFYPYRWASVLAEMGFFHQYTVPAKPSVQAVMLRRYKKFWEKHVLTGTPPEPKNYDDIKRLFPEPKATLIVPERIERILREHSQIGKELKEQEARREEIKTQALSWARKNGGGVIDDDSTEALILRNGAGEKVGSFYKTKAGTLTFRT
jgi:hypothetical protein